MDKIRNMSKESRSNFITYGMVIVAFLIMQALSSMHAISSSMTGLLVPITAYICMAISLNLVVGVSGELSLGHAGFMLIGAYTYAILTIPSSARDTVYQYYDAVVRFSIPESLSSFAGPLGTVLGVGIAVTIAGLVAALFAFLIGLPVLRLKSDYLAIATLGFAEIMRAICQWGKLGPLTNGSNLLKSFARISTFKLDLGGTTLSFSTFVPVFIATVSIGLIVLLVNSTYGRAFKAIRDDEIAAEAMGINLAKHKMLSFCISCFFAGIAGACMAMVLSIAQASNFKSAMTYEILLMVVLGGIGSITGSVIGAMLFISASEWWLRGLDSGTFLGINAPGIFRNGFRLVVFSVIIMVVVLFFRQGIMGDKELPDVIRAFRTKRKAKAREKAGTAPAEAAAPAEGTAPAEAAADETPKGGA